MDFMTILEQMGQKAKEAARALAVAGALLLLGISPEQLSSPPQKSSR